MPAEAKSNLAVGRISSQSTGVPWPNTWTYPSYPTYINYPAPPTEKYANEVEVEQGEHDATLRFYRTRDKGRNLVYEVTVPLGVLEWMQAKQKTATRSTRRKTT